MTSQYPSQIVLPDWPINQLLDITSPVSTWLVGGTVRDLILKRPLHDWDFVTADSGIKLARKAANHFKGAFYVLDKDRETGRAVVYPPDSSSVITLDFASLRDASLTGDLAKRDFTINAMAMSLTGQLIDPLECLQDLEQKAIRMTTANSFKQDPVRLIRAIRQSQQLNYHIDDLTFTTMCRQAHLITSISPERILAELCTLYSYVTTAWGIQTLGVTGTLSHIVPELSLSNTQQNPVQSLMPSITATDHMLHLVHGSNNHSHDTEKGDAADFGMLNETISTYQDPLRKYFNGYINADINRSALLRWAVLFQDVPPDTVRHRLTALRMPNKSINYIGQILETYPLIQNSRPALSQKALYRFFKQSGHTAPGAVFLATALASNDGDSALSTQAFLRLSTVSSELLQAYFEHAADFISPVPLIKGTDILELGIPAGPLVGMLLDRLMEAQVAGEVTTPESAIAFVKNELAQKS